MQLGMVGLGRMGANLFRRLVGDGHTCVVYDVNPDAVCVAGRRARRHHRRHHPRRSSWPLSRAPKVAWVTVPAALGQTVEHLAERMSPGDIVIDGGNTYYRDDIDRAEDPGPRRASTTWTSAPAAGACSWPGTWLLPPGDRRAKTTSWPTSTRCWPPSPRRPATSSARPVARASFSTSEQGYLHCGSNGAGHFVKMVHNGIEYGLMAAYAEGLNIIRRADVGLRAAGAEADAETTPLREPSTTSTRSTPAEVAEVYARGSVSNT